MPVILLCCWDFSNVGYCNPVLPRTTNYSAFWRLFYAVINKGVKEEEEYIHTHINCEHCPSYSDSFFFFLLWKLHRHAIWSRFVHSSPKLLRDQSIKWCLVSEPKLERRNYTTSSIINTSYRNPNKFLYKKNFFFIISLNQKPKIK